MGRRRLPATWRSALYSGVVLSVAALHAGIAILADSGGPRDGGEGLAIRLPLALPANYQPVELNPVIPARDLTAGLALVGWRGTDTVATLAAPDAVPPLLLRRLPADLPSLPETARQALFIATLLPLILHVNGEIAAERARIAALLADAPRGGERGSASLSAEDAAILARIAARYRLRLADPARPQLDDLTALLQRVAPLPVALALSQAAIESAWGGSRFAREGNALFGEWTYDSRIGIVPLEREEGRTHLVRKFPTLLDAVRSWSLLLNTGEAYAGFRAERARLTATASATTGRRPTNAGAAGTTATLSGEAGRALARTLTAYSERRGAYVDDVVRMMDRHGFDRFASARLALTVTVPPLLHAMLHRPRSQPLGASAETACSGPRC